MPESRIPCTTKRIIIFCVLRYNERKFKAEQVLGSFLCFAATGSGKRRINPHLLPLKKPDKVDLLAARKLQLSGGVDATLSCILFFVSGSLQFQLPTKNEIGSPFRGSLSHFLVGAVLQQLLLLAEMVDLLPRAKQQQRVAFADFSAAPWQGFEKSERCPNNSSLFLPQAAVVVVAQG